MLYLEVEGYGCTLTVFNRNLCLLLIFKSKVVIRRRSLDFNTTCTSTCAILLWNAGPCLLKPQISLKTVLRDRLSSEFAYRMLV